VRMQKHRLPPLSTWTNETFLIVFFFFYFDFILSIYRIHTYSSSFGLQKTFQPCLMKKSTRKFEFFALHFCVFWNC
jgi:hypothetical protein